MIQIIGAAGVGEDSEGHDRARPAPAEARRRAPRIAEQGARLGAVGDVAEPGGAAASARPAHGGLIQEGPSR